MISLTNQKSVACTAWVNDTLNTFFFCCVCVTEIRYNQVCNHMCDSSKFYEKRNYLYILAIITYVSFFFQKKSDRSVKTNLYFTRTFFNLSMKGSSVGFSHYPWSLMFFYFFFVLYFYVYCHP